MSKITIGAPVYGSVAPEVLEDWMRLAYHLGRRTTHDCTLAIKTKSEQFRARNAIVEAAQQAQADYLLMIDDDMIISPGRGLEVSPDYDLVDRLIAHDKDICGALYYQRGGECRPVLMAQMGDRQYRFLRDDEVTHGLQRVDVAGGGCLLVKMRVFDFIDPPYFEPEHTFGTDIQLCRAAAEKGFEVWADTSCELGHLKEERAIVTSRTRHLHQMADTVPADVQAQFVASEVFAQLIADATEYTGWSFEEMGQRADGFLRTRDTSQPPTVEWYRQFPMERVARQVYFNATPEKRRLTEYLLSQISQTTALDVLDFGCGIGLTAFVLAQQGHRVTACDLQGTGTLEFLKWRARKHDLAMTFFESDGGIPALGSAAYDLIIAMDTFEHQPEWRRVLPALADRLRSGVRIEDCGVLMANNAILDDRTHPEHIDCRPQEFVAACASAGLMPRNQLIYVRQPVEVAAA